VVEDHEGQVQMQHHMSSLISNQYMIHKHISHSASCSDCAQLY